MKKNILFLSALLLTLTVFASCGKTDKTNGTGGTDITNETNETGEKGDNGETGETHEHVYGQLVAQKAATCTEGGNIAYYYCEGCKTYFDENKNAVEENAVFTEKKGHSYGVDGKCADCDETLSTVVTKEDYFGKEDGYFGTFEVVNGKSYFTFTAECSTELYLYIDFGYEKSYYYDEDFEEKTEQPNYIASIEIYEEGSETNLVTSENYTAKFSLDGGSYWMYTLRGEIFERNKTYTVVLNAVEDYDKEYLKPYLDPPFFHFFDGVGVYEFCGYDRSVIGQKGEKSYYFTVNPTENNGEFEESVIVWFDLDVGKYLIKINGQTVDKNSFSVHVIAPYTSGTGAMIYSGRPINSENNKWTTFTTTEARRYCICVYYYNVEDFTLNSVELVPVV